MRGIVIELSGLGFEVRGIAIEMGGRVFELAVFRFGRRLGVIFVRD